MVGAAMIMTAAAAGCDMVAAAAFPEVAQERAEIDAAAWKRVEARFKIQDGYEEVPGFDSFDASMRSNHPGKMKFCKPIRKTCCRGQCLAGWKSARPELFPNDAFYVETLADTFVALPDASQADAFDRAVQRGPGVICMWSDGERELSSDNRVTVYRMVKWDGIKDDDEAAAEQEVRSRAKSSSSAPAATPASDPEKPPADEPSRY